MGKRLPQHEHLFFGGLLPRTLGAELVIVVRVVKVVERLAVLVDLSSLLEHVDQVVRNGSVDHPRAVVRGDGGGKE